MFLAIQTVYRERSGSVVECLTQDRVRASPASLRCGPLARHIYSSLVLVQPRKTLPCLTERLLMGRKESKQTKTNSVDPDEMPHYVAFHLGLPCLQTYLFRGFQNKKD